MIKKSRLFGGKTQVTFCLPHDSPVGTVSVVGCFNDWEPGRHELVRRRSGIRSVTLRLDPGCYQFRYLGTDGLWFDDDEADQIDQVGGHLHL